jgi:dipeptidyl aminopeptidase/acylaminoacyl peptidase
MCYEFGACSLDTEKRLLRRDGEPVTLAPKTTAVAVAQEKPAPALAPKRGRHRWVAASAITAAAVVAFVLLVKGRPDRERPTPPTVTPLTAYPGIQAQPSLSPDGSQVAFSWSGPNEDNYDIYIKLVGPGEPVRLTTAPERDVAPSWSPDGRQIAFLR